MSPFSPARDAVLRAMWPSPTPIYATEHILAVLNNLEGDPVNARAISRRACHLKLRRPPGAQAKSMAATVEQGGGPKTRASPPDAETLIRAASLAFFKALSAAYPKGRGRQMDTTTEPAVAPKGRGSIMDQPDPRIPLAAEAARQGRLGRVSDFGGA